MPPDCQLYYLELFPIVQECLGPQSGIFRCHIVALSHTSLHYLHIGQVTGSTLYWVGSRWVQGGLSVPILTILFTKSRRQAYKSQRGLVPRMQGDDFATELGGIMEVAMWIAHYYYLGFDLLVPNNVVLVLGSGSGVLIICKVIIHMAQGLILRKLVVLTLSIHQYSIEANLFFICKFSPKANMEGIYIKKIVYIYTTQPYACAKP